MDTIEGFDEWIGVVIATTTPQSNASTAVPFPVGEGGRYSVQGDVEFFIATGIDSAAALAKVTAGQSLRIDANALYDFKMPVGCTAIAIKSVAGTVNAKVFQSIT